MGIFDAISSLLSSGLSYAGAQEQRNATAAEQQKLEADQWNEQVITDQSQIRWKVADAQAAGLSPLAALGVSSAAGPSAIQMVDPGPSPLSAASSGIKDLGQSLDDVMSKKADQSQKMDALKLQLLQSQIAGQDLDNQHQALVNSDRARAAAPGNPPTWSPPLPQADPRYTPSVEPATTRFLMPDGRIVTRPSDALTRSSFATNPTGNMDALTIDAATSGAPTYQSIGRAFQNLQLPGSSDYSTP